jgi:hypothetical protein
MSWRFNLGDRVQYVRDGTTHIGTIVSRGPWKGPDEQMPAWYGIRTHAETPPSEIQPKTVAYSNWVDKHWHLRKSFKNVWESQLEAVTE